MGILNSLHLDQLPLLVTTHGAIQVCGAAALRPRALLPGSFNPIHAGHWRLAAAAAQLLDRPIDFELSIANVDKADLSLDEVHRRIGEFAGRARVWITRAPLFVHKAMHFPGATFVVGFDTAVRLVLPRYYGHDVQRMLQALTTLRHSGCRILVGGRVDAAGRFQTLSDLAIPHEAHGLFDAIPTELFRCDLSSTALRNRE